MKTKAIRHLTLIVLGGALIAGTTACSRDPEPAPVENSAGDQAPRDTPTPDATPTPVAEPTTEASTNVAAPPATPVAPDEQMLDDATATGMTSHASRGDDGTDTPPPAPANQQ
jgi:hypothetical protein